MSKRLYGYLTRGWKSIALTKFVHSRKAVSSTTVAGIAVSALLVAILLPIALTEIANATTTNWETSVTTVFQVVLPILIVVGLALKYIPRGK